MAIFSANQIKKPIKKKRKRNRHRIPLLIWSEIHFGAVKCQKNQASQEIAEVVNEMVGKKIQVNCSRQANGNDAMRGMFNFEIETTPGLAHKTSHTCIHKTGIKRNIEKLRVGKLRITPGTAGNLEKLHGKSQQMKQADNQNLILGFHTRFKHKNLHSDTGQQHQIVAKNHINRNKIAKHQHPENESRKDARKDVFEAEPDKFGQVRFNEFQCTKVKLGFGQTETGILKNHNWTFNLKNNKV